MLEENQTQDEKNVPLHRLESNMCHGKFCCLGGRRVFGCLLSDDNPTLHLCEIF